MHILLTNDDGPPSVSSPYIIPFVLALEKAGHKISVVIPSGQRSWIGKAHMISETITTAPYTPDVPTPSAPWTTATATPAACTQLALTHLLKTSPHGPVDLVLSGPNYGRNTSALFALSSGTLGAALEGACSGARAIALSFAFFSKVQDDSVTEQACAHSVRIVEYLCSQAKWDKGSLYSVNVPLVDGVGSRRVVWTRVLQNHWGEGGAFAEIAKGEGTEGAEVVEEKVREGESAEKDHGEKASGGERKFKWAPGFVDMFAQAQAAGEGYDGFAVMEKETSVTALKANFMHADGAPVGELKL